MDSWFDGLFDIVDYGGETVQVALRFAGRPARHFRSIRSFRALVDGDTAHGAVIDENRGLNGLNVSITSVVVVARRLSAIEAGSVEGDETVPVERLPTDTYWRPVKRLTQWGRAGELAAFVLERDLYPLSLCSPVEDFEKCRFHMKPKKVQDEVLPTGNRVASGMTDLHHCTISKFSSYRDSLFDEAEKTFCTKRPLLLHFRHSTELSLCRPLV